MPTPLLARRLIFVTGKGGVGKSTVAISLGLLGARRGHRTIVAELARRERMQETFAAAGDTFEEIRVRENLYTISIDPEHAMEEYLRVKTGPLGQALGSSRVFQAFAMATPGMRELLSIGKVWELAQFERRTRDADPYDLVIVDAPATGHGIGILRTPRTFAEIARVGPIAHQGDVIARTIADRAFTGVVAVSTAEEMPVNETLALHTALREDGLDLDAVILNSRYPARFDDAEAARITTALDRPRDQPLDTASRAALRAALSEKARSDRQADQHARLQAGIGESRLVTLPYLFAPRLGPEQLDRLADELDEALA